MASTSSSIGTNEQTNYRSDSNSPLWKYVDIIRLLIGGGGGFRWKCQGCDIERNSSYYQVVGHLCGIPGRDIKKCLGKNGVPIS